MPDLRSRILFTLGMLAVFRLGVHIPAPGVDREKLAEFISRNQGTMFGLYDMFSGGALEQFSIFVLGIMPYITASIIIQVLTVVFPPLERISKDGQQGRSRITQYTRYLTIAIALAQSLVIGIGLATGSATNNLGDVVVIDETLFYPMTMVTLTAGSCFVMWIGEQISERGVGNGSSLIITAGIVARLPSAVMTMIAMVQSGDMALLTVVLIGLGAVVFIALIVWIERAQYRIPIQYAKRVVGRRVYGGESTHLPLKINTTGVIPPIFASTLLMFPATIATFVENPVVEALQTALLPGAWLYDYVFVGLIIFISYFYTALMFNPVDVADNLRRNGGYIPGIRPGKQTADYIDRILSRLTGAGAVYLAVLSILPTVLVANYNLPFYFGGTSLLIVVGVSLDTVAQIEAQLLTRHYDGLQGPAGGGGQRTGRRRMIAGRAAGE